MGIDFKLACSVLFFCASVLLTAAYAWRIRKSSFSEPIYQFLFFYALFVLPLPIRACITRQPEGDVTEHLGRLLPYMPWAVILCAIGLPFFVWGYYGRTARLVSRCVPCPSLGKHSRMAFIVLTVIALSLLIILARSSGGLLDFILLGYGATSQMFGKGYLAVGFPWLWVATFFLLYRYALRRARSDLILFALMLGINLLVALVMGQRSTIVYFCLALVLFWHHSIKAVSLRKLVVLGVAGFLALNLVGALRGSKFESLSNFWNRTYNSFDQSSGVGADYLYTLTTGEFTVPFETLPQMIQSVGPSVSPQLGMTYLKAPLFWIPSALYPSRPLPLTNWYMDRFYGSGLGLNEGRAFFFLSEGYLNFGTLGVFITLLLWGVFLGVCRGYLQSNVRNPGAVLLYAFTVAFIMRGIAGDAVSVLVGLPEQVLSAAILGLYITAWRHRWAAGRAPACSNVC